MTREGSDWLWRWFALNQCVLTSCSAMCTFLWSTALQFGMIVAQNSEKGSNIVLCNCLLVSMVMFVCAHWALRICNGWPVPSCASTCASMYCYVLLLLFWCALAVAMTVCETWDDGDWMVRDGATHRRSATSTGVKNILKNKTIRFWFIWLKKQS